MPLIPRRSVSCGELTFAAAAAATSSSTSSSEEDGFKGDRRMGFAEKGEFRVSPPPSLQRASVRLELGEFLDLLRRR